MGGRDITQYCSCYLGHACDSVIFFCSAAQVYSSAEPKLFVQLSKLLLYAKHHQCKACHLRDEHGLYFYFFLFLWPHHTQYSLYFC